MTATTDRTVTAPAPFDRFSVESLHRLRRQLGDLLRETYDHRDYYNRGANQAPPGSVLRDYRLQRAEQFDDEAAWFEFQIQAIDAALGPYGGDDFADAFDDPEPAPPAPIEEIPSARLVLLMLRCLEGAPLPLWFRVHGAPTEDEARAELARRETVWVA